MKYKWIGKESWIPKILKILENTSGIKHKEIDIIALMADELGKQREELSHHCVCCFSGTKNDSYQLCKFHGDLLRNQKEELKKEVEIIKQIHQNELSCIPAINAVMSLLSEENKSDIELSAE